MFPPPGPAPATAIGRWTGPARFEPARSSRQFPSPGMGVGMSGCSLAPPMGGLWGLPRTCSCSFNCLLLSRVVAELFLSWLAADDALRDAHQIACLTLVLVCHALPVFSLESVRG